MRIGIVTTWFERGAAYVSRQYRDLFRQLGHEVFIYARGGEKYAVGDSNWDGPDVTWGKSSTIPDGTAVDEQDFLQWLSSHSPDMVLFNEQSWLPAVVWAHDHGAKTLGYVDYYTEITVPLFAAYDGLICNTKRHYSVFDWHPRCLYVPWGTDTELFRPRSYDRVNASAPTFFHSSGMSPFRKGTDLVIRAFASLAENCHLVIHAQSSLCPHFPELTSTIKTLQGQGRLHIHEGEVSAPGLYHLGDVYVYPSRLEGIGLTLAEALACGLPLITSDNPPMNEFITLASGITVPIEKLWARADGYYWPQCSVSIDALIEAMKSSIRNFSDIEARKKAARLYAEENLDWHKNGTILNEWIISLDQGMLSPTLRASIANFFPLYSARMTANSYKRLRKHPRLWSVLKRVRDLIREHC